MQVGNRKITTYLPLLISYVTLDATCACLCYFCCGVIDSVTSSSGFIFVPTGHRSMMCSKQVPGTHPLISGNHYVTTHIKTAKKTK